MFVSFRTRLRGDDSQRLAMVATTATCGVLLIWAGAATFSALQTSRQLAEANARVNYLTMATQTRRLEVLRDTDLHEVFPDLQLFQRAASNYINRGYLHRFETRDNTIAVFLHNRSEASMRRNFEIRFLNEFGFLTAVYRDCQPDEMIAGGEECISVGGLEFRYGEPVYYSAVMLDENGESSNGGQPPRTNTAVP